MIIFASSYMLSTSNPCTIWNSKNQKAHRKLNSTVIDYSDDPKIASMNIAFLSFTKVEDLMMSLKVPIKMTTTVHFL